MVFDHHGDAAARQDLDRTIREGMFCVAAGAGRLGARPRRVSRHPVWHLPAAGRIIRHVMKHAAPPAGTLGGAPEPPERDVA
jgi:hypothetical protein